MFCAGNQGREGGGIKYIKGIVPSPFFLNPLSPTRNAALLIPATGHKGEKTHFWFFQRSVYTRFQISQITKDTLFEFLHIANWSSKGLEHVTCQFLLLFILKRTISPRIERQALLQYLFQKYGITHSKERK